MNIHEYQGKALFRESGIAVQDGVHCTSVEQALTAYDSLGSQVVAVKSQIHAGGRGKGKLYDHDTGNLVMEGGVKIASSRQQVEEYASNILGNRLVTKQTGVAGKTVGNLYVEAGCSIAHEYYLALLVDREADSVLIMVSTEGGMDIEEVNRTNPDAVVKQPLLPAETADGLSRETALDIVTRANFPEDARDQSADLLVNLFAALRAEDATLAEINPLIRTTEGRVLALDAKVSLDGNAAFRHGGYEEWDVEGIEPFDEQEAAAKAAGIQYVKLDGDVGILGNGAGLVMASLDVVAQAGGEAANFLDIGGGANADTMAESLQLVLSDDRVNSVLINVFGGITQCDLVAKGVLGAMEKLGDIDHKLVVRLDGTNADEGRRILEEAAHPNVIPAATMDEAATKAVEFAAERANA